jgi:BirA family biotin operon repressor/biotin-[acetyl-CoA-carboxylase] ligase
LKSNLSREPLPRDFADAIERVSARLGRLASHVEFLSITESTNDVASKFAAEGDREGAVVLADAQTAGRGRRGHAWLSPPGSGLYVSVVLTPGRARTDSDRATTLVTLAAGVALAEGVEAATGLRVDLKWPNDLHVARRKLAGILAEGVAAMPGSRTGIDPVILGYGINVGAMAFPPALADRATSLERELGRPVERAHLFAETLAALARRYQDLLDGRFDAILDAWRARAPAGRGAPVEWTTPSGVRGGVTAGIDDRGALLVLVGGHVERIVAGELTWL